MDSSAGLCNSLAFVFIPYHIATILDQLFGHQLWNNTAERG